ncbi:UPF0237 protein [Clostridia bacterium]|nr:UPF0237 protein [Clostridia bacterium]
MKCIISVIGKDAVGILAKVTNICAEAKVNIMDVSQTIMQDVFAMTMLADLSVSVVPFSELSDRLKSAGEEMNLQVHVMHEDIFNSMHRI